jgi:hypothetical protein
MTPKKKTNKKNKKKKKKNKGPGSAWKLPGQTDKQIDTPVDLIYKIVVEFGPIVVAHLRAKVVLLVTKLAYYLKDIASQP